MTDWLLKILPFSSINRKKVTANFNGGSITSGGGLLLLCEVDKRLALLKRLAQVITDNHYTSYIDHCVEHMLKQQVYAIAAGYEDVTDHDTLSKDLLFSNNRWL